MSELNHLSTFLFYLNLGDDIFKNLEDKWFSRLGGVFFDENGHVNVDEILELVPIEEYEGKLRDVLKKYDEQLLTNRNLKNYGEYEKKIFNELIKFITGKHNIKIIKIISKYRIYKIKFQEDIKILKFIKSDESNFGLQNLMKLHLDMSNLGIGPHVESTGILNYKLEYLYIIMDYIPLTLKDIWNENRNLYYTLQIRKNKIIKEITDLGWFNIDDHDENFVYNPEKDKLYAIDFTDWKK